MNGIRKRLPTKKTAMAHASTTTTDMISSASVSTCNSSQGLGFHFLMRECTKQMVLWRFLCCVFCHYEEKYPRMILPVVFFYVSNW
jgi:hypothetical protein